MSGSVFTDPFAALDEAWFMAYLRREPYAIVRDKKGHYRVQIAAATKLRENIICEISSRTSRKPWTKKGGRGV